MQNNHNTDTHVAEEELAEVLIAISVVSNRLAKKLTRLSGQCQSMEGGNPNEQNERIVSCRCRAAQMW